MSAAFRSILAPIASAGGTLKAVFSPQTWMGQPATAFAVRRIAMAVAVGLLLAFWLLEESRQVEQAPIIALNAELAMWQFGAELGQPDLLALLIMALTIVVGLARFAGDDIVGRLWVVAILLVATLPLAMAGLPLALPIALGLLGLAASSAQERSQNGIAISVPLVMSAAILILGLSFLATGSFDTGLSDYLAPLEGAAKLAMIGALLLGSFAIPGMPTRLARDLENGGGNRVAILVAISIANGYLASAASGLGGSPPPGAGILFGLLILGTLIQTLRHAWRSKGGAGQLAYYWSFSQILLISTVLAEVSIPGDWYVFYGELAGLSLLFLYCWSGNDAERAGVPRTPVGTLIMLTGWIAVLGAPATAMFNARWLMAAGLPSAGMELYIVWIAGLFLAGGGQVMVAGRVLRGEAVPAKPVEARLQPDLTMMKMAAYAAAGVLAFLAIPSFGYQHAGSIGASSSPLDALGTWAFLVTAAGFLLGLYLALSAEGVRYARRPAGGRVNDGFESLLYFFDRLDLWGWISALVTYLASLVRWLLYASLLRSTEMNRTGGN